MRIYEVENGIRIHYLEFAHDEIEHTHEGVELIYIVDGVGEHTINSNKVVVKSGDIIVMNHDCIHSFINWKTMKYYNVMFKGSFLDKSLDDNANLTDIASFLGFDVEKDFLMVRAENSKEETRFGLEFKELLKEYVKRNKECDNMIKFGLLKIFIKIFRKVDQNKEMEKKGGINLSEALRYINEHCEEKELYCEDVAKVFNYTPQHFSSLLKEFCGMGFKQYVISARLNKAIYYLWVKKGMDINIDDVILKCGFSNKTQFYRTFEKHYGVKPKVIIEYSKNYDKYIKFMFEQEDI